MGPQHEVVRGAPPKELQIPTQISGGSAAIERLSESISQLETRLCSILRDEGNPEAEKSDQKQLVPLANDVREIWNRINDQTARIENICSRLEL